MKKIYSLCSTLFLALGANAQLGQLPNVGFENWSNVAYYDYTTSWKCSNQFDYYGNPTTFKSSDAFLGTSAAELTTFLNSDGDTEFSYVFLGGIGDFGPTGSLPYTDNFNTVKFHYKSNILSEDLYIVMVRKLTGLDQSLEVIPTNIIATQSSWTEATVTLPAGNQDSLFFAFILGDPFNDLIPMAGSSVLIDNVRLFDGVTPTANLDDPSFEDWDSFLDEEPLNWYSNDAFFSRFVGYEGVTKTIDAHSGSFAVKLTNSYDAELNETIIPSFSITPFTGQIGVPYTGSPTSFSFWYKRTSSALENGLVELSLFDNGDFAGGGAFELPPVAAYTQISIPVNLIGIPDSILLFFNAGEADGDVLFIDDVSFSGGNVGLEQMEFLDISVYPNPASSEVLVYTEGLFDYEILTAAGEIVLKAQNKSGLQTVSLNQFPSGVYFVKLTSGTRFKIEKLVIE